MGSSRLKAGGWYRLRGQQAPDAGYLKAFRDGILILVSSEFVFPAGVPNPYDMPVKTAGVPPGPGIVDPVIRPVSPRLSRRPQLRVRPQSSNRLLPLPDRNRNPMPIPRAEQPLPASKEG